MKLNTKKAFDNQYNQFAIILAEIKKDKIGYKKKARKIKNNNCLIN